VKSCPTCNRTYPDDTLAFCLVDGSILSAPYDPQATIRAAVPDSMAQRTEVLASNDLLSIPSLDKTLSALPVGIKPAASIEPDNMGHTDKALPHSLGQWLFALAIASLLGALSLFTYSFILLTRRTGQEVLFRASEASTLILLGAVIGAIHGLVIKVVLMLSSGFLVNRHRAVLVGGIVGTIIALIHRWLIGSYRLPFGPPYGDEVFRLEHLVVAVVYGVSLGLILGDLHRLSKRAV
jgi:hypothetical protein